MPTLLLFKIGTDTYHVEIPEISADRNIPQVVLKQFDAYSYASASGEAKVGSFASLHKMQCDYNARLTTKINYRDFDRAIQHATLHVAEFFKTL